MHRMPPVPKQPHNKLIPSMAKPSEIGVASPQVNTSKVIAAVSEAIPNIKSKLVGKHTLFESIFD